MNADIKGALAQINRSWKVFEYKGKPMTKKQVKAVLEYGVSKGYETTNEISSEEIDNIINNLPE